MLHLQNDAAAPQQLITAETVNGSGTMTTGVSGGVRGGSEGGMGGCQLLRSSGGVLGREDTLWEGRDVVGGPRWINKPPKDKSTRFRDLIESAEFVSGLYFSCCEEELRVE